MKLRTKLALLLVPAVLGVTALVGLSVSSATGSTTPKWYIGGTEMKEGESEQYGGSAEGSTLNVLGALTKCEHLYYLASIDNSGGQGKASVSALEPYECSVTAGKCKLQEPPKVLNQPYSGETVFSSAGKPYLVFKGVKIEAKYTGTGCVIAGTHIIVTGSVGGALENSTQTVVFNKASEEATGAKLETAGSRVEFTGTFNTEDVGANTSRHGELVEAK